MYLGNPQIRRLSGKYRCPLQVAVPPFPSPPIGSTHAGTSRVRSCRGSYSSHRSAPCFGHRLCCVCLRVSLRMVLWFQRPAAPQLMCTLFPASGRSEWSCDPRVGTSTSVQRVMPRSRPVAPRNPQPCLGIRWFQHGFHCNHWVEV